MYYILSTLIMGACNVIKIVKIALLVHLLVQLVYMLNSAPGELGLLVSA